MARLRYVITFVLACAGAASGWQAQAQAPEKLPVVATFSILADFARNVGGERIEVNPAVPAISVAPLSNWTAPAEPPRLLSPAPATSVPPVMVVPPR